MLKFKNTFINKLHKTNINYIVTIVRLTNYIYFMYII